MMQIQINNKKIILIIGILFILIGCKTKTSPSREGEVFVKVVTGKVPGGWGYKIYQDTALYISQPFIPVIPGGKPFATEQDALNTGRLVLEKMSKQQLPALDSADLIKVGIIKP